MLLKRDTMTSVKVLDRRVVAGKRIGGQMVEKKRLFYSTIFNGILTHLFYKIAPCFFISVQTLEHIICFGLSDLKLRDYC